jgi:hypothetical protein
MHGRTTARSVLPGASIRAGTDREIDAAVVSLVQLAALVRVEDLRIAMTGQRR